MKLMCITPTGDRELAFSLCQKWMLQQTVKPDKWVVIDDGHIPIPIEQLNNNLSFMEYVRREPLPSDPQHTLLLNIRKALGYCDEGSVLFIEDDEYYAPEYVEVMKELLTRYRFVGICKSKYYHIKGKYYKHKSENHASLAQTGFRTDCLCSIWPLLDGTPFLDLRLWKKAKETYKDILLFDDKEYNLYAGIKGLPGRKGIGKGHSVGLYKYINDVDYQMLKNWIPKDYKTYLEIINA
jgi:hypothetical protein